MVSYGTVARTEPEHHSYVKRAVPVLGVYLLVLFVPWWVSVPVICILLAGWGYYEVLGAAVLFDALYSVPDGTIVQTTFAVTALALGCVVLRVAWHTYS